LWEKDELFKPEVRPDSGIETLHVPLALVLQPDLLKTLRDYVQKGKDDKGRPIKELGAMNREDFIEFYMKHTTMKTGHEGTE